MFLSEMRSPITDDRPRPVCGSYAERASGEGERGRAGGKGVVSPLYAVLDDAEIGD